MAKSKTKFKLTFRSAVASLTIGVYLVLSNFCLTYAVVTGHFHDPFASPTDSHDHSIKHSDQEEHEHHPCHDHSSKSSSDECCVNFSSDNPVLVAERVEAAKPIFFIESLPVLIEPLTAYTPRSFRISLDHGPPGPSIQETYSSHLTPRAPPSLKSL